MTARFGTTTAPDRPEFTVSVDGTELAPAQVRDVMEIDVDERINGHAIAQILLRNWDPKTREPIYSSQELFRPGAELSIAVGYRNELSEIFTGPITAMTVRFPPEGISVIEIEARSLSARMGASRTPRSFEDVNTADRFDTIAQEYGLETDVADGDMIETHYDNVSDWDRVLQFAERLGWVGYVRASQLVLRPPSTTAPEISLAYGTSLLELRLKQDLAMRSNPVVFAGWSAEDQEIVEAEAEADEFDVADRPTLVTALVDAGFVPAGERIVSPGQITQADVDERAAGAARREQLRHLSGLGSAIGIPQLRCDAWIELSGTGTMTDGPHYVSRARHRIGAKGYTTEFTLGLPTPLAPPSRLDSVPSPGSLTVGVVTDIADPDQAGRVKVVVATAGPAVDAVWARLATLDAGADHGSVFVPSVGNEVVVGFLDHDPVVLGQLYSPAHQPPIKVDGDANTLRGFVTPHGHKVVLDDATPLIEVTTGGGHSVTLDDEAGAITLTESSGNSVTINGDGITIEAGTGDIVLKAPTGKVQFDAATIEGSATGPSKIESSATLDISASATLGLKGALVNIN